MGLPSVTYIHANKIASTEEILAEVRRGQIVLLADNQDRENEVDLVIPAKYATADAINFMARYGRGLICLTLTANRALDLGLSLIPRRGRDKFETAFAVSFDAREGVTTGISAADRALSIAIAVNNECGAEDITVPGHIFPIIARPGGVLERPGHTEAAYDLARLTNSGDAGVICEVMNDDGTMMRLHEAFDFARKHNLKVGTIDDLIAFRTTEEKL